MHMYDQIPCSKIEFKVCMGTPLQYRYTYTHHYIIIAIEYECAGYESQAARFLNTDCMFSTRKPSLAALWLWRSCVMTDGT